MVIFGHKVAALPPAFHLKSGQKKGKEQKAKALYQLLLPVPTLHFLKKKICAFILERESVSRERGRERGREADSLPSGEPNMGLDLRTLIP